ncbi:MAG: M28 family peptidase [Gemmatimonadetes bacterium]|nr:M28 family peptidase [Gemmatimonadota bacterium]MBT6149861.1 M28 family peptidase [Gemmatimonadota bacterium]MBT7858701.1 M28 family peptidase [Gemmatimonadota bacterium]
MAVDPIPKLLEQVDGERMEADLRYLAHDPLPFRKLNYTRPGQDRCTLHEADDYIEGKLAGWGYTVVREDVQVQAFRCDESKPKAHQYSSPEPEDPFYTAWNLYAERPGTGVPDDIILLLAHKDSQSWVDSPGANDNGVGTVALMEIARILAAHEPQRTIRVLFCNEEHRPWTSVTTAERARDRGDRLVGIFNLDGLSRNMPEDRAAGRMTSVTLFTEEEGRPFAEMMATINETYRLGLETRTYHRDRPGDDDGSFINAGFRHAVLNIGSYPYGDPAYHTEEDVIENVDIDHLVVSTRLSLAAALWIDMHGKPPGGDECP